MDTKVLPLMSLQARLDTLVGMLALLLPMPSLFSGLIQDSSSQGCQPGPFSPLISQENGF